MSTCLASANSDVISWLNTTKAWVRKDNPKRDYSHLSMDGCNGGIIQITPADETEFILKYGNSLRSGDRLYFTEHGTDVFRFFIDFDFEFLLPKRSFTQEELDAFCKIVNETVRMFYTQQDQASKWFKMVVCGFEDDPASDEDDADMMEELRQLRNQQAQEAGVEVLTQPCKVAEESLSASVLVSKDGNLHVHFPNLYVTAPQAATMAAGLVVILNKQLGALPYLNTAWEKIVDPSVYVSTGLRMLGSRKCCKCPACHGKKCDACNFVGKVDKGRVYRVKAAYNNASFDAVYYAHITANIFREVNECSIRNVNFPESPGWQKPSLLPGADLKTLSVFQDKMQAAFDNPKLTTNKGLERALNVKKPRTGFADDEAGDKARGRSAHVEHGPESATRSLCEQIVRGFHPNFANVSVRAVRSAETYKTFIVNVVGIGSTFCMNLKPPRQEHHNNSVYFVISAFGVQQRCHCKCDTVSGRSYGKCQDFKSEKKPLVAAHKLALFPESQKEGRGCISVAPMAKAKFGGAGTSSTLALLCAQLHHDIFIKKLDSAPKPSRGKRKRN